MRYLPWFSSSGKVKAEARAKERREHAGNADRAITTTETPRMTKRTTAGRMAEHARIRKAARLAKLQAQEWTQARAIGTTERTTGEVTRMARSEQTDRLEHASVERQERKSEARSVSTVLTKPRWARLDGSQADSQPEDEIHFCMVSGEQCATSTM